MDAFVGKAVSVSFWTGWDHLMTCDFIPRNSKIGSLKGVLYLPELNGGTQTTGHLLKEVDTILIMIFLP